MGRFDRRLSLKMRRRKAQAKKKARAARKVDERKVRLASVHLHCACMRLVARGPDFMLEAHMPEATFGQDELADIEPPLQADP